MLPKCKSEVVLHILLDASNLGATGPEILIKSLISKLGTYASKDIITFLLPSNKMNENWEIPDNVQVKYIRRMRIREISRMWDINIGLSSICKKSNADVYLTLGDIGPVTLPIPHIIYLHNAYLVYLEPELVNILRPLEKIKLRYQRWHFSRSVKKAHAIIVQTPVIANRLIKLYNVNKKNVHIIPPSLPSHMANLQNLKEGKGLPTIDSIPKLSFIFLATYYAHKNHRILLPLFKELRKRNLESKVHFFLTLDGDRRRDEKNLLKKLEFENDMVTNLGRLKQKDVSLALHSADALFMPTLVETFGLIYLEALAAGKPILTSDRDFAHYICGDLALFYDPIDPVSIADAIERFISEVSTFQSRVHSNKWERINSVSWENERNTKSIIQVLASAAK